MLILALLSSAIGFSLMFALFLYLAIRTLQSRPVASKKLFKYASIGTAQSVLIPAFGTYAMYLFFDTWKFLPVFIILGLLSAVYQTGQSMLKDGMIDSKGAVSSPRRVYATAGSAIAATIVVFTVIGIATDGNEAPSTSAGAAPTQAPSRQAQVAARRPSCSVQDVKLEAKTDIVNNDFDWGIEVSGVVANTGAAQYLMVGANLSTSEGEFKRRQRLRFEQGQIRHLKYFIHEPTTSAQNIQGEMLCEATE